jgi:hypothetical protein
VREGAVAQGVQVAQAQLILLAWGKAGTQPIRQQNSAKRRLVKQAMGKLPLGKIQACPPLSKCITAPAASRFGLQRWGQ